MRRESTYRARIERLLEATAAFVGEFDEPLGGCSEVVVGVEFHSWSFVGAGRADVCLDGGGLGEEGLFGGKRRPDRLLLELLVHPRKCRFGIFLDIGLLLWLAPDVRAVDEVVFPGRVRNLLRRARQKVISSKTAQINFIGQGVN